MTEYLQNLEFTFPNGSNFGKLWQFFCCCQQKYLKLLLYRLIDQLRRSNRAKFQIILFSTVLKWNEIIHQKFRHFSTFRDFSLQNIWSVKLADISRRTTNTFFVPHRHD